MERQAYPFRIMTSLRRLFPLVLVAAFPALAAASSKTHQATPVEVLLERYHHAHHEPSGPVESAIIAAPLDPLAARAFAVTARRFSYSFSPAPVVNQGDSVTMTISAGDDGDGNGHGFFLEEYAEGSEVITPGNPVTIQFIADTPGSFTFFCTVVCGTGHTGMDGEFTVVAHADPPPTISSFTPASGPDSGGTTVTINGTNFRPGAVVDFGTTRATGVTLVSATQLTAAAPAHAAGPVTIKVTNSDGTSATSAEQYNYILPGPHVTSVAPSSGLTVGPIELTISGSGFEVGATMTIGGMPVGLLVVASTLARGVILLGPSNLSADTLADVTVTNPDGKSGTLVNGFTWLLGSPTILSVAPATGSIGGGTTVIIRGSGYSIATGLAVAFGDVPAASVTVLDAGTLSAVSPPHDAGVVDVRVTAANGSATRAGSFSFTARSPRRRSVRH